MRLAVLGSVVAVVAAEAARIAHVADVVGMRSPGHLHEGKHILAIESHQFLPGGLTWSAFAAAPRDAGCDRSPQLRRNLGARFGLGGIRGLQQFQALFVDPGQIRRDRAFGHCPVDRVFRGHEGVSRAVVAIDAIHHPPLTLWLGAVQG